MGSRSKKKLTDVNKEAFFNKQQLNSHLRLPISRAEAIAMQKQQDTRVDVSYQMICAVWLALSTKLGVSLEDIVNAKKDFMGYHRTFMEVIKSEESDILTPGQQELNVASIIEKSIEKGIPSDVIEHLFGMKEEALKEDKPKEDVKNTELAEEQFPKESAAEPKKEDNPSDK